MAKRITALLLALIMLLVLTACGGTKTLHCDRCGAEIPVEKDSNITEDWIVFCKDCEEEIGPVVDPG